MGKVLVACEFSGIVRDAFIKQGHDAISCDFLRTERPGPHYRGDVRDIIGNGFDLMIAHPPCTYLCRSGMSHLYHDESRWGKMLEASAFFRYLLNYPIPRVCVENPIMHGYAGISRPSQIIQPWQHGHGETKATGLWLKNLPQLKPTNEVDGRQERLHWLSPSDTRWMERSRTYRGIANAMAIQWGALIK